MKTNVHYIQRQEVSDMKTLDAITGLLVVVGALNWGLVAIARFDLVAAIFGMEFGQVSAITAVVYALVGLSGLYQAVTLRALKPALA
jgi:uncharacterized membrane protein YuzA (DUF378 family)